MGPKLMEAITNEALCHDDFCDCVVCRAASGDENALQECLSAHARMLGARPPAPTGEETEA